MDTVRFALFFMKIKKYATLAYIIAVTLFALAGFHKTAVAICIVYLIDLIVASYMYSKYAPKSETVK